MNLLIYYRLHICGCYLLYLNVMNCISFQSRATKSVVTCRKPSYVQNFSLRSHWLQKELFQTAYSDYKPWTRPRHFTINVNFSTLVTLGKLTWQSSPFQSLKNTSAYKCHVSWLTFTSFEQKDTSQKRFSGSTIAIEQDYMTFIAFSIF